MEIIFGSLEQTVIIVGFIILLFSMTISLAISKLKRDLLIKRLKNMCMLSDGEIYQNIPFELGKVYKLQPNVILRLKFKDGENISEYINFIKFEGLKKLNTNFEKNYIDLIPILGEIPTIEFTKSFVKVGSDEGEIVVLKQKVIGILKNNGKGIYEI